MNEELKDFSLGERIDNVVNGVTSIAAELKSKYLGEKEVERPRIFDSLTEALSERKSQFSVGEPEAPSTLDGMVTHYEGQVIGNYAERTPDDSMEMAQDYDSVDRDEVGTPLPSPSSFYEIKIEALNSGFLLKVGCQKVAVESPATVAKLIEIYLTDGHAAETRWYNTENRNIQKFIEKSLEAKQQ